MLQEIQPRHLDNQYHEEKIGPGAKICVFRDQDVLVSRRENEVMLPSWELLQEGITKSVYLFSVDSEHYFLAELDESFPLPEGYMFDNVRSHRNLRPKYTVYAEMTAWHLYIWYRDNRFCGRCAHPTAHDGKLRMLKCPACGNMIFPKICPAIIVAVTDGDRLLSTQFMNIFMICATPVVGLLVVLKKDVDAHPRPMTKKTYFFCFLSGLIVGAYDGFFGPGTGTFLILLFTSLTGMDMVTASATAKPVNLASNISSLITRISAGQVLFTLAVPAMCFSIAGGWLGSKLALTRGAKFIRYVMLGVLALLVVTLIMDVIGG